MGILAFFEALFIAPFDNLPIKKHSDVIRRLETLFEIVANENRGGL